MWNIGVHVLYMKYSILYITYTVEKKENALILSAMNYTTVLTEMLWFHYEMPFSENFKPFFTQSQVRHWILLVFLYSLEKSENLQFSDVFRGYKKRAVAWNELNAFYCSIKPDFLYELMWINLSSFPRGNFIIHVKPNGNMGQKWCHSFMKKKWYQAVKVLIAGSR